MYLHSLHFRVLEFCASHTSHIMSDLDGCQRYLYRRGVLLAHKGGNNEAEVQRDLDFEIESFDRCKENLRTILHMLVHKQFEGGVLICQIADMYEDMTGESLPYRRFNFSSLEALFLSIPDVCSISGYDGDGRVKIKGTPETMDNGHALRRFQPEAGKKSRL